MKLMKVKTKDEASVYDDWEDRLRKELSRWRLDFGGCTAILARMKKEASKDKSLLPRFVKTQESFRKALSALSQLEKEIS